MPGIWNIEDWWNVNCPMLLPLPNPAEVAKLMKPECCGRDWLEVALGIWEPPPGDFLCVCGL